MDDNKTLAQARFVIGDYLDIAITPPTNGGGRPHHRLGMISHKKSLKTIFGHKHKITNFIKKFYIFHEKILTAFGFWFIFEIKLLILN